MSVTSTPSHTPRVRTMLRRLFLAIIVIAVPLAACAPRIHQRGAVHVLKVNDLEVNSVLEGYIGRGIDEAERTDAKAVVIELDTPGGLSSSMDHIVQRIQQAKVPVIVYVGPSGARAASAGTFITMSADIAAMAPGTRIGAAHPIDSTGGDIGGTLGVKVENDAAAFARSVAQQHGRNADWAERAVRDSVSASTDEAVKLNVVDYSADNIDDLLRQADGRAVEVDNQQVTLAGIETAPRVTNDVTLIERFLFLLSDPNLAFLLLALGGLGMAIELAHPGVFLPGVAGAILLVLAFLSLGTLPVNWAGVALVLLAFVLFTSEFYVGGIGALGIGGAISLVAGGLLLTSTSNSDFQVSRWLVIAVAAVFAAFFAFFVSVVIRTRRKPAALGTLAMVGNKAIARSDLNPDGYVFVEGERWKAVVEGDPVRRGEAVTITAVRGLTLTVRRRESATGPEPTT